jgi:hypothetical protein
MKPIKTTSCPTNLLFFDTETKARKQKDEPESAFHYLWFGYALACNYSDGVCSREKVLRFSRIETFWRFVLSRSSPKHPLYLFAHNLPFDLTICDFWDTKVFKNAKVRFTIFEDPPTVISLEQNDCVFNFVDTLNYWRMSLKDLGASIGVEKKEMPGNQKNIKEWNQYCFNDVRILKESVIYLMRFIQQQNLGPFAFTQASQAMAAFKTRFMNHEIYIHDNYKVLIMERKAYHGGLVKNFYIGKVRKKVWKLDVNSLYPSVMLREYPVKLESYKESPSIKNLVRWSRDYGIVAQVDIKTKNSSYCVKTKDGLLDVKGEFTTELCGSELLRALQNKEAIYCYSAALYKLSPIFVEYINFFWNKRLEFRKPPKNEVYDLFCKLMMNSLYGKFGQRSYEWVDLNFENFQLLYALNGIPFPEDIYTAKNYKPNTFLTTEWIPYGLNKPVQIRSMGKIEQMRLPVDEHAYSCPIIAAYVTSYARERLRELIKKAGYRNVYYCDTDSLFVNKRGFVNLDKWGEIDSNVLGKLKIEEVSTGATFYCPKVYDFNGKHTIKGIRKDAIQIGINEYLQNQFEGLRTILKREPKPYIKIAWVTKANSLSFNKGHVLSNGWTKEFTYSSQQNHSEQEVRKNRGQVEDFAMQLMH